MSVMEYNVYYSRCTSITNLLSFSINFVKGVGYMQMNIYSGIDRVLLQINVKDRDITNS